MANEIYKEQNIEKVLLSALSCFEEMGFYNTKLETVAKKAGVTLRSVTRYYGTKDNLLIKVLGRYNKMRMDAVQTLFVSNSDFQSMTGYEQIERILMKGFEILQTRPNLIMYTSEIERYLIRSHIGHELQQQFDDYYNLMTKITRDAVDKGIKDKSIRSTVIYEDAISFVAELYGPILERCAYVSYCRSEKINPEKYCKAYINGILRALV